MPDPTPQVPLSLFDHNWSGNFALSSEYTTQIERNVDGTERRVALRGRPRRVITRDNVTLGKGDAARLLASMEVAASSGVYTPVDCDETITTGPVAGISDSFIPCDTSNRRFFVDHGILIVRWRPDRRASVAEYKTIRSISSSGITTVGLVSGSYPIGSSVFPAIISDVSLEQSADLLNDSVAAFDVRVRERVAATTLPPLVAAGAIPSGASSYRGIPVLDIRHDWQSTSEGATRQARTAEIGLGTATTLYGEEKGVRFSGDLAFSQTSRSLAFDLLRFFDSRRGSAFPFWYPMKSRFVTPISKTGSTIRVSSPVPASYFNDTTRAISVWMNDYETVLIRFVVAAAEDGDDLLLTLDSAFDQEVEEIERISLATLARFDTDTIEELWETTGVMRTSLPIVGVPFSGNVSCEGDCCEAGQCGCVDEDCDEPEPFPDPGAPLAPFVPTEACEEGTPTVPMYYDMSRSWNSGREPIRAADLNMPDEFPITIKDNFSINGSHPFAPSSLSQELKDALFRSHVLDFTGTLSRSGKSRNPYHYGVSGTDPTFNYSHTSGGEVVQNSPYWQKQIDYTVGEAEHTLTIRAYAEWVNQTSGDSGGGAWGAIFVLWAWTTEIGSYTDGTPFASFQNITFNKADPIVGGLYVGRPAAEKWPHPLALFVAVCPTTWHAPIGFDFHSQLDRNQYLGSCFRLQPGAPWSSGGQSNALDNSVFGFEGSPYRAVGSFGGWTKSQFFNWICIEPNRTIILPSSPGWDEDSATLTPGSADISINVCTPQQDSIDPCDGHPSDRFGGKGGTHDKWRSNHTVGSDERLCIPTDATTSVRVVEQCVTETSTYDASCNPVSGSCSSAEVTSTFQSVSVEDYSLRNDRFVSFKQYVEDPDYVRLDWPSIECQQPGDYWFDGVGTATVSESNCESEPSGDGSVSPTSGKQVNSLALFGPEGSDAVEDGTVEFTHTLASGSMVGAAWRAESSGGEATRGYIGIVDTDEQKLRILVVTGADTVSVLAESPTLFAMPDPGVPVTLRFRAKGDTLTLTVDGVGSVEAVDCTYPTSGRPGIASVSSASFSVSSLSVTDNNWRKVEVGCSISDTDTISCSVQPEAAKGRTLVGCNQCTPSDCPRDEDLNCMGPCTSVCSFITGQYTAQSSDYPTGSVSPNAVEWHPPTDVGNCDGPPVGGEPPCQECPPPWPAVSWFLESDGESIWRSGLTRWVWTEVAAP